MEKVTFYRQTRRQGLWTRVDIPLKTISKQFWFGELSIDSECLFAVRIYVKCISLRQQMVDAENPI